MFGTVTLLSGKTPFFTNPGFPVIGKKAVRNQCFREFAEYECKVFFYCPAVCEQPGKNFCGICIFCGDRNAGRFAVEAVYDMKFPIFFTEEIP